MLSYVAGFMFWSWALFAQVIPELQRIAAPFKLCVRHSVTDRYAANRKAENGLTEEDFMPNFVRDHGPCDVHKMASCLKHALHPLEYDVAGVLATGLALAEVGAAAKLRRCLAEIFQESLIIDETCPPEGAAAHRELVYDTFLPVADAPTPSAKRSNTLRRWVLNHFLNSDLRSPTPLKHHCSWSCCVNRQRTMDYFRVFVCWALIPFKMPVYSRKDWRQSSEAVEWAGILAAHGLLARVLHKFVGKALPAVAVTVAERGLPPLTDQGLQGALAGGWSSEAWVSICLDFAVCPRFKGPSLGLNPGITKYPPCTLYVPLKI